MILGIDPGERRVGLAIADEETRFAHPLETIDSRDIDPVQRITQVVEERGVRHVVIGRPVGLSGVEGHAMEAQKTFLVRLRSALAKLSLEVSVDVYDERMTTVIAERGMREAGMSPEKRKERRDAVAAQVMLQGYLDMTKG